MRLNIIFPLAATVVLNLWVVTPKQPSEITEIYIAAHDSSKITVMKYQLNNFMVGGHYNMGMLLKVGSKRKSWEPLGWGSKKLTLVHRPELAKG